jgi:hypothetical protein
MGGFKRLDFLTMAKRRKLRLGERRKFMRSGSTDSSVGRRSGLTKIGENGSLGGDCSSAGADICTGRVPGCP